jgi:hypothetical protein
LFLWAAAEQLHIIHPYLVADLRLAFLVLPFAGREFADDPNQLALTPSP